MGLKDYEDDHGFDCVGPLKQVSIDVRVDKETMDSGMVEILAEWIATVPTNKERQEKKIRVEELGQIVEEALAKISENHGAGDREKALEIRKALIQFGPYFRRVDCERLGLMVEMVHPDEGGPEKEARHPFIGKLENILGKDRVSFGLMMSKEESNALDADAMRGHDIARDMHDRLWANLQK